MSGRDKDIVQARKTVLVSVPAQIVGNAYFRERGRIHWGALQRGFDALAAAGYAVVPVAVVGARCPFDSIDHGGLSETDPCPVCGELGRPDGEPVRNCVSGRAMLAAAGHGGA